MIPPKNNNIYAMNATILDIQPFKKPLLKVIKIAAKIKNRIPAKDTHIFIIGSIRLTSYVKIDNIL